MTHPKYLYNEQTEVEYILVSPNTETRAQALEWLADFAGYAPQEEGIGISASPVWLRPDEEGNYWPSGITDLGAVKYWKTNIDEY